MPKDAEITRIEFEGPRLAIYVKNVALLAEQSYVVTEIVNLLHKRIVVRSDQSIRLPEREAEVNIRKILPIEAEVESVNFDPSLGEVVRAAMLIQAGESNVLLDAGINPGAQDPSMAFPRFDMSEFNLERLDAVVISHAHLDHCGILPFLFKYGYDGPIYCSEPTQVLMTLHQLDYLDVHSREGEHSPFDQKDVREVVTHTIPLRYNVVTDVAPDIKLTLHNAGHILGSSIVHLHIGEGLHNIVYSADFKFGRTMMLDPAMAQFPRAATLNIESTYGGPDDIMPDREGVEGRLVSIVNETVEKI